MDALVHALARAFDQEGLKMMVRSRFDLNLDRIVDTRRPLDEVVLVLIQTADRAGWIRDLVEAAYSLRPKNRVLASLYQEFGFSPDISVQHRGIEDPEAPRAATAVGFERVIQSQDRYLDIGQWRERLAKVEGCVCRVEVAGKPTGTGFLVGPDSVLTSYAVLESLLRNQAQAPAVVFRFDYKVLADGTRSEGEVVRLARDWLIDACPYAPWELGSPSDRLPTPDELDYALVRLERSLGEQPLYVGGQGPPVRGWLTLPSADPLIERGKGIIIVQYPLGQPLRLSVSSEGLLGLNENETRLRYAVATEPGSAGSPCFDSNWQLVAMHHAAGPDGVSQGIPIAAIRERLEKQARASARKSSSSTAEERLSVPHVQPPEPGPILHEDDPQKGRWGKRASRNGRKLTVELAEVMGSVFYFNAAVASTDGTPLEGPVVFHLHDTYPKSVIRIRKIRGDQTAVLEEVNSYGVYTIGAQVKDHEGNWIGLEFDLSKLKGLPKRFGSR